MNFIPCTFAAGNGSLHIQHPLFEVKVVAAGLSLRQTLREGASCVLGIRPEDIRVETRGGDGLPAAVYVTEPLGGETVVDLRLGDRVVKALAPPSVELVPDAPVCLSLDPSRLHVFKEDGEAVLSAAGASIFSIHPAAS
jgi:ABC-type sugar transport system ATPase subunit